MRKNSMTILRALLALLFALLMLADSDKVFAAQEGSPRPRKALDKVRLTVAAKAFTCLYRRPAVPGRK